MRLFLCLLAIIGCANFHLILAQSNNEITGEIEPVKAEKFFLRDSDPARDLRFEISDQLTPRLLRGDSVVWQGEALPSWPNQTTADSLLFSRARFSPNGQFILVAAGRVTRLYAVKDGAIKADLTGQVSRQFRFSPDSVRIASIYGSRIRVWNLARNAREADWSVPAFERNMGDLKFYAEGNPLSWEVEELVWSPNGAAIYLGLSLERRIVVPHSVRSETSVYWAELAALEVDTGQLRWQTPLQGPITPFYSDTFPNFVLSADGARLGCGVNGQTRLVDTQSGAILQTDTDSLFQNAGFSGDSRLFFVASHNEARLYRARDGLFVGTRTLTGFSPKSVYNPGQLPRLDQHGGAIITDKGRFPLATMWKRGYDWEAQGARARRLAGFSNITWSPRGRAITFDANYLYRWNASMTRIEARYEHPFRDVRFAQVDGDEKTLWVWGDYYYSDHRESYTRFTKVIGEAESGSYVAAFKIDLTNDQWQLVWHKPFGVYGLSLSPDAKLGAITQWQDQPYNDDSGHTSRRSSVSGTQIFDARSGRIEANIDVPFFAGDVSISNQRLGGRLVMVHRQRAWETRLFVLEETPRQLWNAQVGGGFFIPGNFDLFNGEMRVNTRNPRQITRFPNLNMRAYTRRGIFAFRQIPNYRTAPTTRNIDGNGNQHLIVDRNGQTLGILPRASLPEQLLDFAPNGQAVTREDSGAALNFWRVQKP